MQDQVSLQTIKTACVFVFTPLNLQVSLQAIQSADHTGWQTVWSVNSSLMLIGLGISFPASPKNCALAWRFHLHC